MKRHQFSISLLALCVFVLPNEIHAQFTGNNQTNIISGVVSNWSGTYYVGGNYVFDALFIQNGGVLSVTNGDGNIGSNVGANSNSVVVSGIGSVWSNSGSTVVGFHGSGNSLVISNGGRVISGYSSVGNFVGADNNSVVVSGNGSVWTGANVNIAYGGSQSGFGGSGNSLVISNGAKVFDDNAYMGGSSANSNKAIVTGIGSVWSSRFVLAVGVGGSDNSLIVKDGGTAIATNGGTGVYPDSTNNLITISGGNLIVTNSTGDARFSIRRGHLTFDGGTITVDNLLFTNGLPSVMAFNSGSLNVKATAVSNAQQFVVGDGVNIGNFHLLGGTHSFNDGLRIHANSLLTGCGTVNGSVQVDAGAVVRSDCSTLTFTGNVTNNGTMLADGAVLESSGTLVNNGTIYLFNGGTTNFHGTFVNNGSVVSVGTQINSSISHVGDDIFIKLTSIPGLMYQLQRTPSLQSPVWSDIGMTQSGTGGVLTFTDFGAATNASFRYYRVQLQ